MSLISFHRFLISAAIVFCGGYALWEVQAFNRTNDYNALMLGISFSVICVGFMVYLWKLNSFLGLDADAPPVDYPPGD